MAGINKYVSSSSVASDANTGDDPIISPWKTIQHGVDWFAQNRPPNTTCMLNVIGSIQENVVMHGARYNGLIIRADQPVQPYPAIEQFCEARPQIGGDPATNQRRPGTVFTIGHVDDLTFKDLTILLAERGIRAESCARLTIDSCCIHGHVSGAHPGGGIDLHHCEHVFVTDCRIWGNSDSGVYVRGCKDVRFNACHFYLNEGTQGGALRLEDSKSVTVAVCQIGKPLDPDPNSHVGPNKARSGGGISITYCRDVVIEGAGTGGPKTVIDSNEADEGGGLLIWSDDVTVADVDVIGNKAQNDGAGMRINGTDEMDVQLYRTRLEDNETNFGGGGGISVTCLRIRGRVGRLSLKDCRFMTNPAFGDGGAIKADDCALYVDGGVLHGNSAQSDGGGIFCGTALRVLSLHGVELSHNRADERGGGVFARGFTTINDHTRFLVNTAKSGGGLYYAGESDSCEVRRSIFEGNKATDMGGGCLLSKLVATQHDIRRNTFSGNKATDGGGLAFDQCNYPFAYLNIFIGNIATAGIAADILCNRCLNVDDAALELYNTPPGGAAPKIDVR